MNGSPPVNSKYSTCLRSSFRSSKNCGLRFGHPPSCSCFLATGLSPPLTVSYSISSCAHLLELHDPHILHLRLHTLPNLKSMNFSVGSLSGVQSVRLVFILYMEFCLFEV